MAEAYEPMVMNAAWPKVHWPIKSTRRTPSETMTKTPMVMKTCR